MLTTNRSWIVYDIRVPKVDVSPPTDFIRYLNTPKIQKALGVNLNYTQYANYDVFYAFAASGDYAYPSFRSDFEWLLEHNVRVTLCEFCVAAAPRSTRFDTIIDKLPRSW